MNGIIALDIDGTVTVDHHPIEEDVVDYLSLLSLQGWQIIFITGRTFNWGYSVLKTLPFPYYFAVQNGAITLEMPSKKIISKKYLDKNFIIAMDLICQGEPTDYVIYTGFENEDHCYFRPNRFSPDLLDYLEKRCSILNEVWEPLDSYDHFAFMSFPSIKCFGDLESLSRIAEKIEKQLGLHVPVIRDAFDMTHFVAQATHGNVNKGQALLDFSDWLGRKIPLIAAGDDYNDLSMLEVATIKVVMGSAPKDLLEKADVIAPPASEKGIIKGLQQAIQYLKDNNSHVT